MVRAWRKWRLTLLAATLGLTACGGGSSGSGGSSSPPPASFSLSLTTSSLSLIPGDQNQVTVTASPKNGFSGVVALVVSGLPSGVSGAFTQNSIGPNQSSNLVLQASASVAPQTVSLQVSGTSGGLSDLQVLSLTVVAAPQGPSTRSTYINVDGALHEIAYDPVHKLVFAANPALNQVEVLSTTTQQRMTPLPIPQPWTLDVTPDSSLLWVGNTGEFLSAVDLATMQVVQRVTPPRTGTPPFTTVRALITTSNGSLLLRVGEVGVTGDQLEQYNPTTGQFVNRSSEAIPPFRFVRSDDGSKVLLGVYGEVSLYDAASDTFLQNTAINGSPLEAISPDGSQIAVRSGSDLVFLNNQLQEVGRVTGLTTAGSPVYSRDGRYVYLPQDISITRSLPSFTVLDSQSFAILGQIPDLFLTGDPPPYCDVIDVCDAVPGGTTLRTSEGSGLLIGPSPYGLSFVDSSNPRSLPAPAAFFNLNPPFAASPGEGALNAETALTLNGLNFASGAVVGFGAKAAAVISTSANQMQVVAPSSSSNGPVNITAAFSNGWSTVAPSGFSYGPQVKYVLPTGDRTTGGSTVFVFGYGFGTDVSRISLKIGGHTGTVTGLSLYGPHSPLYLLQATAPPGTAGLADLTISTPGGSTTLPSAFHYWQSVQDFPVSGNFTQVLFDRFRKQAYLLDSSGNRVQVFSATSGQFLAPIATGTSPSYMTLLPDGSLLAVANTADKTISLIDPANPTKPTVVNVAIPNDTNGFQPVALGATSTGKLLINYWLPGNYGDALEVLDLKTLALAVGSTPPCLQCVLDASADGNEVFFADRGTMSGTVSLYEAASSAFTLTRQLQLFPLVDVTTAPDGNRSIFNATILDATNTIEAALSLPYFVVNNSPSGVLGQRIQSGGGLLYLPLTNGLQIYDLPHAQLLRVYSGLTLSTTAKRTIALDDAGQTIYAISPTGLEVAMLDSVPVSIGHVTPAAGSAGAQLVIRGSGFTSASQVTIGGVPVVPTFVDANTLQIVAPALPPGSVRVSVSNPNGDHFDLDSAFTAN